MRVVASAPGSPRPPRTWTPASGPGLRLDHRAGEALDVAWVRRQFARNDLPDRGAGGLGRALALVQVINRAYLSAGFVNSGLIVRPQPTPGVLDLELVLGGLSPPAPGQPAVSIAWTGDDPRGLDAAYVIRRLPSAAERPLSAIDLERDFRLLAEDPAVRTINAELKPGAHPGEATLALSVYPQDRYDLYITAANDRSPSVGGERLAAGGTMRNALAAGDLLSGEVGVTGAEGGLYDAALSYAFPLFGPRTMGSLRGAYDDADVIDSKLKPLGISARDRLVEGGLSHKLVDEPLLPDATRPGRWTAAQSLTLGAFVDWRQTTIFLFGERFSFAPGEVDGRADYTALRLTADYVRRNVDQAFAASLTGTIGLDGTRSQVTGVTNPKPDFHAALAQLNYARRLSVGGLELHARLAGQWTDGVVYAGERFSAGGGYTVRGYRENLLLADRGLIGSLELAQPVHLGGRRGGAGGFDWGAFAVSGFLDGAAMRNAAPPQPLPSIYSAGVSILWAPSDAVSARVTYGQALKHVDTPGSRDLQDRGLEFRITTRPLRWF